MPIGPQNIKHNLSVVIKKSEKYIDSVIMAATRTPITIDVSNLDVDCSTFTNDIAPKYKNAGWNNVSWVSDQRDGDFISLS